MNRIRLWMPNYLACQWTTALCINCRSIWKRMMAILCQSRNQLYWWDEHDNRMRLLAQPSVGEESRSRLNIVMSVGDGRCHRLTVQLGLGIENRSHQSVWFKHLNKESHHVYEWNSFSLFNHTVSLFLCYKRSNHRSTVIQVYSSDINSEMYGSDSNRVNLPLKVIW